MRAVGYVRVSTEKQADVGVSVDARIEKIRAVDAVIIARLDRLTRSVVDLAELLRRFERRSVSLVSVADSPDTRSAAGRLVLNIMVSVSQWEREAIGERTRDAMRHKHSSGQLKLAPLRTANLACAIRRPSCSTRMRLASRIVDSRCAMTMVVRRCRGRCGALKTASSEIASSDECGQTR